MKKSTHTFLRQLMYLLLITASVNAYSQTPVISGKVTSEGGETIPGVNIILKGTTIGTVSDVDGNYSLPVPDLTGTLIFSYIGFVSVEVPVNDRTSIDIVLVEDVRSLGEVVVVGYGTQKKINLTGAVAQVDEKLLSNRAVANIGQALQGTVANLNISQTNAGGAPGSGVNYNIRGATSLSSDGSPFFVVDGIPVDNIQNINPADVKNVTVLKDAAASAIYGARAAYGVILVTTKSGSKSGKATISYNNMFGFNSATNIPDQVNSLEFAEAYNIASLNAGQSPMFSAEHIARIKAYIADPVNTPSNIPNPNNPDYWSYATLDNDNVDCSVAHP